MKEQIDNVKLQTRSVENDVYFLMSGVENLDAIKEGYDAKVDSLKRDIELLQERIEGSINEYSKQKIESSNIDIAFKKVLSQYISKQQNYRY